jgi:hypothetical protein
MKALLEPVAHMPVILATQEAEIRRTVVQSQHGQVGHETLSLFYYYYYSYVHTRLGSFLPPCPHPPLPPTLPPPSPPPPPQYPAEAILPLFLILL